MWGGFTTYGQIYVSPKTCAVDVQSQTDPNSGMTTMEGCLNPVYFFDENQASENWEWNFGDTDGDGQPNIISGVRNPQQYYASPGTYTVSLTRFISGLPNVETTTIEVGAPLTFKPKFNGKVSADTTVCGGDSLELNPFKLNPLVGNLKYLWFPTGDTTKTIKVGSSGCYSVEVSDPLTGCSRSAKINVKFCLEPASSGGGPEKWYFGQGATLEFNVNTLPLPPDSLSDDGDIFGTPEDSLVGIDVMPGGSNPLNSQVGTAMIYGPNGLAFYTDGTKLFNGNDDEILDASGQGLNITDPSASQGLVIIPKIECASCSYTKYYVFHKDKSTGLLSYSVIDMRYNDSQGQITERNVPVAYDATDRIGVIPGDDGYQLIIHDQGSSQISTLQVDSTGLNTNVQIIGTPQNSGLETGQVAFSPDYDRMAHGVVVGGENFIEVISRDPDTGLFTNSILIPLPAPMNTAPPTVYGLSFTQSGNMLYATVSGDPALNQRSFLIQVPLFLGDPAVISSQIQIISSSQADQFGMLQLGPVDPNQPGDKYMYMAVNGKTKVAYMQQPELPGGAAIVGYINSGTGIDASGTVGLGFPTIVYTPQNNDSDGVTASFAGTCFNVTTSLNTQEVCDPMRNQFEWEFEDGTTMKGKNVNYKFPKTGWNKVTLKIKIFETSPLQGIVNSSIINEVLSRTTPQCKEVIFEDSVYIKPAPEINLADSSYICLEDSIALGTSFTGNKIDPKVSGGGEPYSYLWTTTAGVSLGGGFDATAPILEVKVPATYVLEVENRFKCKAKDQITLTEGCEPRIYIPEAMNVNYVPNSEFKIIAFHIVNPLLKIYDRWGEIVYETENLDIRWDGRVNGRVHSPTLYPYILFYDAEDFPERGRQKETGAVWVFQ